MLALTVEEKIIVIFACMVVINFTVIMARATFPYLPKCKLGIIILKIGSIVCFFFVGAGFVISSALILNVFQSVLG